MKAALRIKCACHEEVDRRRHQSGSLPEGKDRLELSDASCPGLILRVTKTGSKTFLFKYWSPLLSETVGLTLGSYPDVDLAAARAKVADHRKTISLDEDPRRILRAQRRQAAREEELSFDEFADLYIAEYVKGPGFPERPNKKSWQNDVGYLKRPRAEWGKLPAAAATDDDAAELLDVISETAPVSANRTQSVLHTMFKWGKQPGRKYVPSNPLAEMSRRGAFMAAAMTPGANRTTARPFSFPRRLSVSSGASRYWPVTSQP